MNQRAASHVLLLLVTAAGAGGCDEPIPAGEARAASDSESGAAADPTEDAPGADAGNGRELDAGPALTMDSGAERDGGTESDGSTDPNGDAGGDDGTERVDQQAATCVVGAPCQVSFCTYVGMAEIDGVSATPVEFATGEALESGCYRLSYVEGVYRTGGDGSMSNPYRYAVGTYLYSDGVQVGERIAEGAQTSIPDAEDSAEAIRLMFQHCGGPIAVGNGDLPTGFADNAQGDPNPTWRLEACEILE